MNPSAKSGQKASPVESKKGLYKMRTFAQLAGFSPVVLRAWERRHKLLEPVRLDSGHRLYTPEDLAVMQRVKKMLDEGRSIGEVAALGRTALLDDGEGGVVGSKIARIAQEASLSLQDRIEAFRDEITASAEKLDRDQLENALDGAFTTLAPQTVVNEIIKPAARKIGALWAVGKVSVAGEHMVSAVLQFRLQKMREQADRHTATRHQVVCATLPGENHELGILTVALELSLYGIKVAYLGRDLPLDALDQALKQISPMAVCLSVTRPEIIEACAEELAQIARRYKNKIPFHLGGSGVPIKHPVLNRAGVRLWGPDDAIDALMESLRNSN